MNKNTNGKVKEQDLFALQEKIRNRLMGSTPVMTTMSAEKLATIQGDEWAKIFEYHIEKGKAKDRHEAVLAAERREKMRQTLEGQMREVEARKKQEHEEEIAYFNSEQAALKDWQRKEEERKRLQHAIQLKLKQERAEQLQDKETRRQRAIETVRAEEEDMAARIAYQTRTEFEAEEEARLSAKKALKDYLLSNETNKKLKEEAKQKAWAEDKAFKAAWEAILDKQERERAERLIKLKAIQAAQEAEAKLRPESKKWIDPAIIEKYYKEREDARAREDDERQRRLKEGGKAMAERLAAQIVERQEAKMKQREEDEAAAKRVLDRVAQEEAREQERQRKMAAEKLRFRAELEAQMKENALRRRVAPMTLTERQINAQLLDKVTDWKSTGRLLPSR